MNRTTVVRWVCAACVGALVGCASGQKVGTSAVEGAKDAVKETAKTETSSALKEAERTGSAVIADKDVEGDVIAVTVTPSKDLNTFNNQPHTLVIVFYQLSQSSVFSQFLDTPEGKAKLLSGDSFDASVVSRRKVVVQPGVAQTIVLDRIENARYLGVVAGYYNVQTRDMSRLVPVVRETTGMLSWKKPKPMFARFSLGRSGFEQ